MSETMQDTYLKYKHLTMISERGYLENLKLIAQEVKDRSDLSIVECGTWRGGMTFGMLDAFRDCPEFHAFDSFEGLPEPSAKDGERARQLSQDNLFFADRNFASYEEFLANAAAFGVSNRLTVHKGWFDQTVSADRIRRPIGVLRLDGDWYDSTMIVLERLYDAVAPGGLIIIDDYYVWPGCSQAVHDFLSSQRSPDVLKSFGRLTAYIRKRPPDYLERRAAQAEIDRRKRWKSARLGLFTDAAQGRDGSSA